MSQELTEAAVIAGTSCPHPGCKASRGQACKPIGAHYWERTLTHRGRWQSAERELRRGQAIWPPEGDE
jgi:hypothetical protein